MQNSSGIPGGGGDRWAQLGQMGKGFYTPKEGKGVKPLSHSDSEVSSASPKAKDPRRVESHNGLRARKKRTSRLMRLLNSRSSPASSPRSSHSSSSSSSPRDPAKEEESQSSVDIQSVAQLPGYQSRSQDVFGALGRALAEPDLVFKEVAAEASKVYRLAVKLPERKMSQGLTGPMLKPHEEFSDKLREIICLTRRDDADCVFLQLLQAVTQCEIEEQRSGQDTELFRRDWLANELTRSVVRTVGCTFVQQVVDETFDLVSQHLASDCQEMCKQHKICPLLVDEIKNSLFPQIQAALPSELLDSLSVRQELVAKNYGHSFGRVQAISLLWLRIICPALTNERVKRMLESGRTGSLDLVAGVSDLFNHLASQSSYEEGDGKDDRRLAYEELEAGFKRLVIPMTPQMEEMITKLLRRGNDDIKVFALLKQVRDGLIQYDEVPVILEVVKNKKGPQFADQIEQSFLLALKGHPDSQVEARFYASKGIAQCRNPIYSSDEARPASEIVGQLSESLGRMSLTSSNGSS